MGVPLFDPRAPLEPLSAALREAVDRVLDGGHYVLGPEVTAFEQEWAAYLGVRHAVGVANGTEAIAIALAALGVKAGDDVVVPSFTFFASVEPIVQLGANPVFCDVDPQTFVATPETVRAVLTPKTTAVIAVHLFGNVAPIAEIARETGLPVLEDAAQSAGTTSEAGRPGSLGAIATFSFYPSKNLGAFGDGGAIVTDDDELAELVRTLRFHGSRDKVTYTHVGWNSRLDELQAAILRVQLPQLDAWAQHRRTAAAWYADAGLAEQLELPVETPGTKAAWHLYVPRAKDPAALVAHLQQLGIGARQYYDVPIHRQPVAATMGWNAAELPGTEEAARTHVALPISAAITREQIDEVVAACASGST